MPSPNISLSHNLKVISYIFLRGDIIYKELVKRYLKRLSLSDLQNFKEKNHIPATNEEVLTVYNFIMENQDALLNKNDAVLEKLKSQINKPLFDYLKLLYDENKDKI